MAKYKCSNCGHVTENTSELRANYDVQSGRYNTCRNDDACTLRRIANKGLVPEHIKPVLLNAAHILEH